MTDYAVTPFEPIVQGLVTNPLGLGNVFEGRGCLPTVTRAGGLVGTFILTLDPGLPGNAGAVPPGTGPFINPDVRTMVTTRGQGVPPVSPISTIAVTYVTSFLPGVGANRVLIVMTDLAGVLTDPPAGFEIIIWRVFSDV
jgi:hypothetical protein